MSEKRGAAESVLDFAKTAVFLYIAYLAVVFIGWLIVVSSRLFYKLHVTGPKANFLVGLAAIWLASGLADVDDKYAGVRAAGDRHRIHRARSFDDAKFKDSLGWAWRVVGNKLELCQAPGVDDSIKVSATKRFLESARTGKEIAPTGSPDDVPLRAVPLPDGKRTRFFLCHEDGKPLKGDYSGMDLYISVGAKNLDSTGFISQAGWHDDSFRHRKWTQKASWFIVPLGILALLYSHALAFTDGLNPREE